MTVQELMERSGMEETGRALAYIKDALDEMNIISETHTRTVRIDIVSGKRFYHLPNDMLQILDIRCKNHNSWGDKAHIDGICASCRCPECFDEIPERDTCKNCNN